MLELEELNFMSKKSVRVRRTVEGNTRSKKSKPTNCKLKSNQRTEAAKFIMLSNEKSKKETMAAT